jgi:hypothetical protein
MVHLTLLQFKVAVGSYSEINLEEFGCMYRVFHRKSNPNYNSILSDRSNKTNEMS